MSTLVCNAIGLTNLAPPALNLAKMLSEETTAGNTEAHHLAAAITHHNQASQSKRLAATGFVDVMSLQIQP